MMVESLRDDTRYAVRSLRKTPGFTLAAIFTFALGIGANATTFGVIDRLLLRPPPHVEEPGRVVRIGRHWVNPTGQVSPDASFFHSYPSYRALRDDVVAFERVAAMTTPTDVPIGRGDGAIKATGLLVTASYFGTLGVRPALGRFFLPEEDVEPVGTPVAVLGYGFWRRVFAGDQAVIGRPLDIGPRRYTIVGVAPEGFTGLWLGAVDVWVPISAGEGLRFLSQNWSENRGATWVHLFARLRPGVEPARAADQATAAYRQAVTPQQLASAEPRVVALPVRSAWISDGGAADDDVRVAALLGAVSGLVLLIACANVANLLLARALRRRREIAVRLALGVRRGRLASQLVTESLVLSLLGGAAAVVAARWGGDLLRTAFFGDVVWVDAPVDGRVLGFAAVATLATGLLAGLVPALQASGPNLVSALKAGTREGGVQRSRTRATLLVVQTALAVVLLVGTGLFVRSLRNVTAVPTGMQPDRVLMATLSLRGAGYTRSQMDALFERMAEHARAMPGVERAAIAATTSFSSSWGTRVIIPGHDSTLSAFVNAVSPAYFETIGTRVLSGRGFTDGDRGPAAGVVISARAAQRWWAGDDAIGRCVRLGADTTPCVQVVGVVEDVRKESVVDAEDDVLQVYVPLERALLSMGSRVLVVRPAARDVEALVAPLRRTLQQSAPGLPYVDVRPMSVLLDGEIRPWRLGATMFGTFGLLAAVLTAVGLYGVVSYTVAQRTQEMGVRIALGAQAGNVVGMVMREGMTVTAVGGTIGLVLALVAAGPVEPLLFRVSPRDPLVLGAVAALLVVVAAVASVVPAWRAARTDPIVALRAE